MDKKVKIILSQDAKKVYKYLNKESKNSKLEKSIFNAIKQKIELIKENFQYGDPVSKKLVPKKYIKKYGITNLFRVELPNYWRMLYSVQEGESRVEIIAFVLDIIDHDDYDKLFGYN